MELRDEANAKRRKKAQEPKTKKTDATTKTKRQPSKKKCPYCNEEGHTIQSCMYMEALLAGNAAKIELKL